MCRIEFVALTTAAGAIAALKHALEKWKPSLRKDPAQTGKLKRDGESTKDHRASERDEFRSGRARFRPQPSSWGAVAVRRTASLRLPIAVRRTASLRLPIAVRRTASLRLPMAVRRPASLILPRRAWPTPPERLPSPRSPAGCRRRATGGRQPPRPRRGTGRGAGRRARAPRALRRCRG